MSPCSLCKKYPPSAAAAVCWHEKWFCDANCLAQYLNRLLERQLGPNGSMTQIIPIPDE